MSSKPHPYFLLTAVVLAGCGGSAPGAESGTPPAAAHDAAMRPAAVPRPACAPGTYRRLRTARTGRAAVVVRPTSTARTPGGRPTARFGIRNVNGVPTVLGVLGARLGADCSAAWYRVQLPVKPNGATGWVRAADVRLVPVAARVLIDLSDRRVTLFRRGRPVFETLAAIGRPSTPTPTGAYYVDERLVPSRPDGPFGPGAIGISAFSEVLTDWVQGGPIAIHGTDHPELLGRAASNGCVRVRNDALKRLWREVVPGTPVVVRA